LACLIILRGPQCSGKTEVSQRLRETLDEKHKKRTYLLKLNEVNTERFKKALNEALDKKYKYVVGELNCGDSHNTDPKIWLQCFKDKHYLIISFVLVGGKQVRLQRCKRATSIITERDTATIHSAITNFEGTTNYLHFFITRVSTLGRSLYH
jgi:hypothetical protein